MKTEEQMGNLGKKKEDLWAERAAELNRINTKLTQEISRRIRVERALRESKEGYKDLVEKAGVAIVVYDSEGHFTFFNRTFARLFGYSSKEMRQRTLQSIVHPDDWDNVPGVNHGKKKRPLGRSEFKGIRKDGRFVHLEAAFFPLTSRGENGRIRSYLWDITERKQTAATLQKERNIAQQYLDISGVMFVAIDAHQTVSLVNKKGCEILGYRETEIVGKNWFDNFIPQATRDEVRAVFEKLLSGEIAPVEYFENSILTKGGQEKIIAWHNTLLKNEKGKPVGTLSSGEDITERRRAEEALRKSEETYRFLYEESPAIVLIIGQDGLIKDVNKTVQEEFGYTKNELIGQEALAFVAPAHRDKVAAILERDFRGERTPEIAVNIFAKDGSIHTVLFSPGQVLLPEKDHSSNILIIGVDVTGYKRAERELQESESRYRDLFENANDIIYTHDLEGHFTSINTTAQKISGYSLQEALKLNIAQILAPEHQDIARQMISSRRKNRGPTTYELDMVTKNGRRIPLEVSTRLVYRDGNPVGVQGIARDITERKRTEAVLRESEEKFRELANSLPQIIFESDSEGTLTFANRNAFQLFGYTEEDMKKGLNVLQTIVPEDRDRARMNMIRVMRGEKFSGNEYKALKKNGSAFPVVIHSSPVIEKGRPRGLRGLIIDISDRVQAEERFRLTARVTADLIYEWDIRTDGLQWFGKFDEALGYKPGEIERTIEAWVSLIHPEDRDRLKNSVERHRTSTKPIHEEYRVRRKDGKWLYWMDKGTPVLDETGRPQKWIGGCSDITERKRSEAVQRVLYQIANAVHTTQDLRALFNEIRQELSSVLNTENFFIALYDQDDDTFSLPYFEDERDEFQTFPAGKTLTAYVVRNDKALLITNEDIKKLEESGEVDRVGSPSKIWLGVPLKVGQEIIGALVVQSYTDEHTYDEMDLEILKFVSNQIGISIERKRAEEGLKASEERYRIVTDQTGQLIYDYDVLSGRIEWSGAIQAVSGYTPREFQKIDNDRWKQMIHPGDREKTLHQFAEIEKTSSKYRVEYRLSTKNGVYKNILDEGVLITDGHGGVFRFLGAMKDVTEQKRAEQALRESEEQLRQSQKMEAVGQLAGGIAHDLNNLLTGVTGYSDLLAIQMPGNGSLKRYVTEIQKAAQRATSLIGQLLAFSRKQILQPKVLNLNETAKGMEDMLRRIIGEDVKLTISLDSQLGFVKADPGQMEQVIMNLAVNARDAMPQGGTLTIETSNVNLDAHYSQRHRETHPGSYVMLAISDTGVGMDKETQRRIFEPFFTTKEVGKGTGLGLSTIYGIIKQSEGHIWVYSEPGHGTTFKIYLPRIQKNPGPAQTSSTDEEPVRGTETILVVEDEDTIRELAEEILQTCGYMVLTAHDGEEALTICEDHCGAIDLLLTDVIMPRMNGRDLAERMIRRWPKIKVLYISGYTDDFVVHRGELDGGTAFLQKPFSAKTLTEKIRCILDLQNRPVPENR